jgi:hypothetical protein
MSSPGGTAWNLRNPGVKRIVQELKELQRDDNPDILAEALEASSLIFKFKPARLTNHSVPKVAC